MTIYFLTLKLHPGERPQPEDLQYPRDQGAGQEPHQEGQRPEQLSSKVSLHGKMENENFEYLDLQSSITCQKMFLEPERTLRVLVRLLMMSSYNICIGNLNRQSSKGW